MESISHKDSTEFVEMRSPMAKLKNTQNRIKDRFDSTDKMISDYKDRRETD